MISDTPVKMLCNRGQARWSEVVQIYQRKMSKLVRVRCHSANTILHRTWWSAAVLTSAWSDGSDLGDMLQIWQCLVRVLSWIHQRCWRAFGRACYGYGTIQVFCIFIVIIIIVIVIVGKHWAGLPSHAKLLTIPLFMHVVPGARHACIPHTQFLLPNTYIPGVPECWHSFKKIFLIDIVMLCSNHAR